MRLYNVLLYFLQTALHVSYDTVIHYQEHIQTVLTTSGIVRNEFATVRWRGGVGASVPTPPQQRTVANKFRKVPDVVIRVWVCYWWWMSVSSVTCRAVCRNIVKTVYSRILLDNYWQLFCKLALADKVMRRNNTEDHVICVFVSQLDWKYWK